MPGAWDVGAAMRIDAAGGCPTDGGPFVYDEPVVGVREFSSQQQKCVDMISYHSGRIYKKHFDVYMNTEMVLIICLCLHLSVCLRPVVEII